MCGCDGVWNGDCGLLLLLLFGVIIGGGIIELVEELGVVEGVVLTPDEIGIKLVAAVGVAVVGSGSGIGWFNGFNILGGIPGDWLYIRILWSEPSGRLFFFKLFSSFKTFLIWLNKSLFFFKMKLLGILKKNWF